jgi:hypothetical protein
MAIGQEDFGTAQQETYAARDGNLHDICSIRFKSHVRAPIPGFLYIDNL